MLLVVISNDYKLALSTDYIRQISVTGKNILATMDSGEKITLGSYESRDRAYEVFDSIMLAYNATRAVYVIPVK